MNHLTTKLLLSINLTIVGLSLGCASGQQEGWNFVHSLNPRNLMGKQDEVAPPQIPTRLVSTWEDTVLNRVGKKPQRGFGGRLLFFNEESDDPVRVDGQLVIYAYDEHGRADHETHPTRRYVYPAENFALHESECQLGPSYSIWLPWDELGGEQKNISLIARFEPKGGVLIAGDQTRHLLPGTRQLADGETAPPVQPVGEIQLTEFTQQSEIAAPAQGSPKPISIALSQASWQKRLVAAKKANARQDKDMSATSLKSSAPTAEQPTATR